MTLDEVMELAAREHFLVRGPGMLAAFANRARRAPDRLARIGDALRGEQAPGFGGDPLPDRPSPCFVAAVAALHARLEN